ncbi:hypothetical protein BOTBODRAFT_146714 [Botryobasidium botryosum FD-172 SS1]|uniref:Uncharacterized protein n=1 Tax=Botryobasidium botryosum (strain FD-172 SS1) TaxID=930990 RepID=A0A067M9R7_BOTB1|nr:hypothetical protein BOTBODRAFT_146714 [Botryobasidium botryosum FD-172 SS1]
MLENQPAHSLNDIDMAARNDSARESPESPTPRRGDHVKSLDDCQLIPDAPAPFYSPPEPLENPVDDGIPMDEALSEPPSSPPAPVDEPLLNTPITTFPFLHHLELSPSHLNRTPPRNTAPHSNDGIPHLELPPPVRAQAAECAPHAHEIALPDNGPSPMPVSPPVPPSSPLSSPIPPPPLLPVTPNSVHAAQATASPERLPLTQKEKINAVFRLISLYFGSLGLFLIAAFSSDAHNRHRGQFCRTHLLTVLGMLWNVNAGRNCLQPWAFQRVTDILRKETQKFGRRLVVGYKNITRAFLKNHSIKRLSE